MPDQIIAKLKQRITFEICELQEDGQGGFNEVWSDFETVWARVKPTSAASRFFAERLEDNYDHEITIRENAKSAPIIGDLLTVGQFTINGANGQPTRHTKRMRIKFNNRYFNIQGIRRTDENLFWVTINAKENRII